MTGKWKEIISPSRADDSDDSGLKLTYHFDLTVSGDHMQGKAYGRSGDRSWTLDISANRQK